MNCYDLIILKGNMNMEGKKIVCVKFDNAERFGLLFLVDDVEDAACPGYPAISLDYVENEEQAKKMVSEVYFGLKYQPQSTTELEFYGKRVKDKRNGMIGTIK